MTSCVYQINAFYFKFIAPFKYNVFLNKKTLANDKARVRQE